MDTYLHRLDILLAKQGWNRKQLAMECGINVATVQAYWSKNRPPKAEDLIRIARGLGTTAEYIMTGDNPPADTHLSPEVLEIARGLEKLSRDELIEVRTLLRAYSLTYFRRAIDRPLRAAENPGQD